MLAGFLNTNTLIDTLSLSLQTAILLSLPALLLYLEPRLKLLRWLGAVFFCYVIGIIWGNLPVVHPDEHLLPIVLQLSVPLAIPLLLFPTNISAWLKLAPKALLSFALWILALGLSAWLAHSIFQDSLPDTSKLVGMTMGVYTGGTPNLAAIHQALEVSEEIFVEMNFTDLILSGVYLMFVLTAAQRLFRWWLPAFEEDKEAVEDAAEVQTFNGKAARWRAIGIVLLLGLGVVLASIGMSFLFTGGIDELFVIVAVTLLGIGGALVPYIREQPLSYDTGQYLMMIFCIAVGAMVDLQAFFQEGSSVIRLMASMFIGALIMHSMFAKFLGIDADTALITSTAGIFGPPFIGPVAKAMNNRAVIPIGMTLGVIGLAFGNLVGIFVSWLLGG